ncbi:MAG: MgtC/SapB family protein [Sarcina sp.]
MLDEIGIEVIIIRLIIACFIGGIVGFDREKHNRAAGFRTHILVCIGACIISLIELKMENEFFRQYQNLDIQSIGIQITKGRLVAQVISGIGFLGAGSIIVNKGNVRGLTTAASLWVVACLGIAIGYGQIWIAIYGVIIVMITLKLLMLLQQNFINKNSIRRLEITCIEKAESMKFIEKILFERNIEVKKIKFLEKSDNENYQKSVIELTIKVPRQIKLSPVISALMLNENIIKVKK